MVIRHYLRRTSAALLQLRRQSGPGPPPYCSPSQQTCHSHLNKHISPQTTVDTEISPLKTLILSPSLTVSRSIFERMPHIPTPKANLLHPGKGQYLVLKTTAFEYKAQGVQAPVSVMQARGEPKETIQVSQIFQFSGDGRKQRYAV